MKKPLVIFGAGELALLVKHYFEFDSDYKVVAFTVDDEFVANSPTFEGLDVHPFSNIEQKFPPNEYDMFVAVSYSKLNKSREKKYFEAKQKGYKLASYISSHSTYLSQFPLGENCFIFENNSVQPYAKIGNNVIIWSGSGIGHHAEVYDHNFIAAYVIVGGHAIVKSYCFLSNRCTINPSTILGEKTVVGAGAIITKNTEPESVWVSPKTIKMPMNSSKLGI